MKKSNKTIGYLRVSTLEQNISKSEAAILKFANDKQLGTVKFVEEHVSGLKSWKNRELKNVVDSLSSGDNLIVAELSRIGRSIPDILNVLETLTVKGVKVYSVKENFQLNGEDMQSKIMRTLLALFSEIEHDLIIMRTNEGLLEARKKGRIGGRPKGSGSSKLDTHKQEIITQIEAGIMKSYIAKVLKVSPGTLSAWLAKNNLKHLRPLVS